MPRRATSTSFKKGHVRSQTSIEKQRATMKQQLAKGTRTLPTRPPEKAKGPQGRNHPKWVPVGTKRRHTMGYIRIKIADPNVWAFEHRHVASQTLGRDLEAEEVVHHKNGKRDDNRPENLVVMHRRAHNRQAFPRCPTCGYIHPPH